MVVNQKQGKGRFDWLQKGIKDVASATSGAIEQVSDLAEKAKTEREEGLAHTMDPSLRLAVTGLSRSGKTAFPVSLGNGTRRLYLNIVNYLGAWLLDLFLLNKSHAQRSQQTLAQPEQQTHD